MEKRAPNAETGLHKVIAGAAAEPADGRYEDLIDPSTGEVFASTPVSGKADVDRAMRAAADAFETWRDTTPSERQRALLKFADAVEASTTSRSMRTTRVEADHCQLKRRLRPMRGLQTDRTAQVVVAGHAFVQNLRRGHYDIALDTPPAPDSRRARRAHSSHLTSGGSGFFALAQQTMQL